jgi:hypothetical protein
MTQEKIEEIDHFVELNYLKDSLVRLLNFNRLNVFYPNIMHLINQMIPHVKALHDENIKEFDEAYQRLENTIKK